MGVDLLVLCLYLLAGGVVGVFKQFTSCDGMLSKTWPGLTDGIFQMCFC